MRDPLPTIKLGEHDVTRMIIGGNPFSGHSHVSAELSNEMEDYYTADNIKKTLFEAERCGLNTMLLRADRHIMRLIREYRLDGGSMHWIAQTAPEMKSAEANIHGAAEMGAIAIYHHGGATDVHWRNGTIDQVREPLRIIRDLGLLVGLGTHEPDVIAYAEDNGWDVDFYMGCSYNVDRRTEAATIGNKPLVEQYLPEDRDKMLATIRATAKPCLAFKILAASRHCSTPQTIREAFEYAFNGIKDTDAVVVGFFQKHKNQIEENAAIVRDICG